MNLLIKPNRRQLIDVLVKQINRKAEQRRQEANEEMNAIRKAHEQRVQEFYDKAADKAEATSAALKDLKKFADKHNIELTNYRPSVSSVNSGINKAEIQVSITIKIDIGAAKDKVPQMTKEENEELNRLNRIYHNFVRVNEDSVMAHIAEIDPDTKKLVEEMADKVTASIAGQTQLLITQE